jgi:hypothetical protein
VRDFYNYEAKGKRLVSGYGSLTPAKAPGFGISEVANRPTAEGQKPKARSQ